jgi:hypothetical protein
VSKSNGAVECFGCGRAVKLVRSVRIRDDGGAEFQRICDRWPDPNAIPAAQRDQFDRVLLQDERNSKHRRAFVCEACYKRLDNTFGVNEIMTANGPQVFGLSGECREGRAAVYTYEKWVRYQQRVGCKMGIAVEG